ncbi:hypothetical protein BCAH1134_C0495 (plasmid) [Bacillus cereus AH1134]|nr:hypothetical protein BCAH1134_C0495 [Bacillus cereus AH1134]
MFLYQNSIVYIEQNKRQLQLRVVFLCNKIPKIWKYTNEYNTLWLIL